MRVVKIATIAAAIVVALAALAWLLRNHLIEKVSNPLLEDYGIVVTDVSLDALSTGQAGIRYLELVYDEDTTVAIHELTLPIRDAGDGPTRYRAKRVEVVLAGGDDEPLDVAPLIDQFLSLSDDLAGKEFLIDEFAMLPYPAIRGLHWVLQDGEQTLDLTVHSIPISAAIRQNVADVRTISLSSAGATPMEIAAVLRPTEAGFSIEGSSTLQLPDWIPLARLAGIVPEAVLVDAGSAVLDFDADIPTGNPPSLSASLDPASIIELRYRHESGAFSRILVESGSPIELSTTFTGVRWSLLQDTLTLLVSFEEWQDIPLTLRELSCTDGPVCSMSGHIAVGKRGLPIGRVAEAQFRFAQDAEFRDGNVLVSVAPGATLEVRDLDSVELALEKIEARLVSDARLEITDSGWRLAADSLDATVDALRLPGDVRVTAPIFLENLSVRMLDEPFLAEAGIYVPRSTLEWHGNRLAAPGLQGSLSREGPSINAELKTVGLEQDANLAARHDLDADAGSLVLREAILSFFRRKLSDRISPWRNDWDLGAGSVAIDLEAGWQGTELRGRGSARVTDLAGFYEDNVFAGLSTTLDIRYGAGGEISTRPSQVTVALIDVGIPIEDVFADYSIDPETISVTVEDLKMTALGGVFRADPFSFHTDNDRNTLLLRAESIDLVELVAADEYRAIDVTGTIGGELPVVIEEDSITIAGGTLKGDPPGGVIRYLPDTPTDESDVSSIGLVRRALNNFEYESLVSEVDYTEGGDLKLQLRLEGRNPDLDEDRPIVLNLGVESNVPQMLRSLRATRAVEEILERRLQEQRSTAPNDSN